MPHRPNVPSRTWRPETIARPQRRLNFAICVTILALLSVGTSIGGFRGDFVLGDAERVEAIRRSVANGGSGFFGAEDGGSAVNAPLSPLARGSLLGDYRDDAGGSTSLRGTNVLLHAAATLLLFMFSLQLGASRQVALAAGALFAVHPLHIEGVAWTGGRAVILCGLWTLIALACYARAHASRSIGWFVAAIVGAVMAALSHRAAVALPLQIAAIDLLGLSYGRGPRRLVTGGMWREGWRGRGLRLAPFLAILVVHVVWCRTAPQQSWNAVMAQPWSNLDVLGTHLKALCQDIGLLLAPLRLRPFEFIDRAHPPFDVWFWIGLPMAGILVVAALRSRRRTPVVACGLLLLLAAWLGLSAMSRPTNTPGRLRYVTADLYLPAIGLALGLAALAWEMTRRFGARRQQAFAAGMALLTGTATVRALARVPDWHSDDSLSESWVLSSPHDPWVLAARASVLRSTGRLEEAERLLDTALTVLPRDGIAALELARLEIEAGRLEAAVVAYRQAVEALPGLREARLGLAKTLRQLGRLPEAAQQYAVLAARYPHDVEILVNEGELRLATGQLDAASRSFQTALQIDPNRKEAIYDLGIVALRHGDFPLAIQEGERALQIDSEFVDAHMLLGNVATRQERWSDAALEFERALTIDSTRVEARVNLGGALLDGGEPSRAAAVLEKAVQQSPSLFAWLNLAHAQSRSGRPADAERSFEAALELEPDSDLARRGLGLLLASQTGRADEACTVLLPVVAANPQDTEVSTALRKLGRGR